MPDCEESRKVICKKRDPTLLALILFGEDGFPNPGNQIDKESVKHVQGCESCLKWLKESLPKSVYKRYSRLNQYCCPVMYVAVEEPKEEDIHMKVRHAIGENLWMVHQPERKLGFVFFSFCPWCGKKLPEGPFIDDKKGWG